MTVVEAYFAGTKLDPCDDVSQMSDSAASLIIEGIAQNTTGTVFLPEVQKSLLFIPDTIFGNSMLDSVVHNITDSCPEWSC
jgi:hypothetical protein